MQLALWAHMHHWLAREGSLPMSSCIFTVLILEKIYTSSMILELMYFYLILDGPLAVKTEPSSDIRAVEYSVTMFLTHSTDAKTERSVR